MTLTDTLVQKPASSSFEDTRVGLVPADELVSLCAADTQLYCRTFFPKAFRQKSPPFHTDITDLLENRVNRHVAIEMFRGAAKTTLLRAYTGKRIAYGISRTILFVSDSQSHAQKSLQWIRKAVEHNTTWRSLYGLSKGNKWTDDTLEIKHNLFGHTSTILALGITGQIRGVNIDDYRPDLIVVDDPANEENTGTPEQRKKTNDLFFGALEKSLTPRTECPDAKMVLLQTSLHKEDLINNCHADPSWATRRYGCFDEHGVSRWPDRFETEVLNGDKQAHADRGNLLLWLREMECVLVNEETADFREDWLRYWEEPGIDGQLVTYISIDPTPPPSERQIAEGMARKDEEVISVVGAKGGNYYLLEEAAAKDHTPEWTVANFFRLVDKWKPIKARVEGVAYQRTLKWILEQAMRERKRFIQIDATVDQRKKRHRILQAFSGIASQKRFYIHRSMVEFKSQFVSYPQVSHDDRLDAAAMAISAAMEFPIENELVAQPKMESLGNWRYAP
jgi:hypothetical protein